MENTSSTILTLYINTRRPTSIRICIDNINNKCIKGENNYVYQNNYVYHLSCLSGIGFEVSLIDISYILVFMASFVPYYLITMMNK